MLKIRLHEKDVLILEDKRSHTFAANEYAGSEVQVLRVAYERWGRGTIRPPARFPHWTMYFVQGGEFFCENTGGNVGKNSILVFPPDAPRGIACEDAAVELGLLLIAGPAAAGLIEDAIGPGFQHLAPADFPAMWHRFEMMLSDALSGRPDAHTLCRLWATLILQTLSRMPDARRGKHNASKLPALARELMDQHWHRFENASAVAGELRVHPSYLYREFRKAYHCTPGQYMLHLKMRQAADDLVRFRKSLAQIAEAYGFSDPFSFSRAFKRVMGEAPSRFASRFR